jgi:hypothetical protein
MGHPADIELFHDYLYDVVVPKIKDFGHANGMMNDPGVLLMSICSIYSCLGARTFSHSRNR